MVALIILLIILLIIWIARPFTETLVAAKGTSALNDHRRVTLYYTTWCRYCTMMKPIWAQVKIATKGSGIEFSEVDADKVSVPFVTSYPTIIMLDENGNRHQYKGGPNFMKLRAWIVSPDPPS